MKSVSELLKNQKQVQVVARALTPLNSTPDPEKFLFSELGCTGAIPIWGNGEKLWKTIKGR